MAKNIGFCFGVRRAIEMAQKASKAGQVYTYGEIIHNADVVRELEKEGIRSCEALAELKEGDTLVIRSHGVPPSVYQDCENVGIRLIDATCPYVKRIHRIVAHYESFGYQVVIV